MQKLLAPREAANILGISYPTLKQWIYHGKIKSVKTPGGHRRATNHFNHHGGRRQGDALEARRARGGAH